MRGIIIVVCWSHAELIQLLPHASKWAPGLRHTDDSVEHESSHTCERNPFPLMCEHACVCSHWHTNTSALPAKQHRSLRGLRQTSGQMASGYVSRCFVRTARCISVFGRCCWCMHNHDNSSSPPFSFVSLRFPSDSLPVEKEEPSL